MVLTKCITFYIFKNVISSQFICFLTSKIKWVVDILVRNKLYLSDESPLCSRDFMLIRTTHIIYILF